MGREEGAKVEGRERVEMVTLTYLTDRPYKN